MEKFSKTPQFIQGLFNQISRDYDRLNDIMSFGNHLRIKKSSLRGLDLSEGAKVLDLCTGTGDVAGILKDLYPTADIIGVDFSEKMLEIARAKHPSVDFRHGDVSELPFGDGEFDLCVISFGLRNTEDLCKVLREIHRVLKPDATFVNIDLGKPSPLVNLAMRPVFYLWAQAVGLFFHGDNEPYKYLAVSNEDFPSQHELVKIFKEIGFEDIRNRDFVFGQIASQACHKKKVEEL